MENRLMAGAKNCIENYCRVKEGEEVAILRDDHTSEEVVQALRAAAYMAGAQDVIIVSMDTPTGMPPHLFREYWTGKWPKVYEGVIASSDVFIRAINKASQHNPTFPTRTGFFEFLAKHKTRYCRFYATRKEVLASEYGRFPRELVTILQAKAMEQVKSASKVRVTDPNGTDISFVYKKIIGSGFAGADENANFFSFQAGNIGLIPLNANGVIVSSYTHQGPIDTIKLEIKDNRAVAVEGGGAWGRDTRRAFEKYKDLNHGFHPAPGINWLEECMWGTHPKAQRFLETGEWSHMGSRAAGPVHLATGCGASKAKQLDPRFPGLVPQHRDYELYDNNIDVDGKRIIEQGRLLVLDDPEVKAVAEKYGDPDELLASY